MFRLNIGDKEYKVKFGYGVLGTTNLIDKVTTMVSVKDEATPFRNMIHVMGELLLAGLQKHHSDEFGYDTDAEKKTSLAKVFDLIDQYEEEGTEDDPQDGYLLFEKLQNDLEENGFLSKMTDALEKAAAAQDATVIPKDHKKPSKQVTTKK